MRRCASKYTGSRRVVDWGGGGGGESHIDWRRERVPARMLGLEGGGF